jgi:hypothetical protein
MAVTLTANEVGLTTDVIRMFLRDDPNHNILLDGELEFPEADLNNAMRLAVSKWNAVTPVSNVTDPRQINEYVLLCGVCGLLLKSEGLRQLRNQLQTQEGNIAPVGIDEKESLYLKWADHFQREFMDKAQKIKIQNNIESLLGVGNSSNYLSSGYALLGRYRTR